MTNWRAAEDPDRLPPRLDLATLRLILETQQVEYCAWGRFPTAEHVAALIGIRFPVPPWREDE